MNNLLLDTNILVYAFDQPSKFHQRAVDIFLHEENNLFITTKNISDFFAVCSKLNLDLHQVFGFYSDLKNNCCVLKPNDRSLVIFETLVKKYKPRGNRVYDVEIVSIMLANGLKQIATVNVDDFKHIDEIELVKL